MYTMVKKTYGNNIAANKTGFEDQKTEFILHLVPEVLLLMVTKTSSFRNM